MRQKETIIKPAKCTPSVQVHPFTPDFSVLSLSKPKRKRRKKDAFAVWFSDISSSPSSSSSRKRTRAKKKKKSKVLNRIMNIVLHGTLWDDLVTVNIRLGQNPWFIVLTKSFSYHWLLCISHETLYYRQTSMIRTCGDWGEWSRWSRVWIIANMIIIESCWRFMILLLLFVDIACWHLT